MYTVPPRASLYTPEYASFTYNKKMKQFKITDTGYWKEAQLMLTNPRDAFSGQSMSTIVYFAPQPKGISLGIEYRCLRSKN